MTYISMQNELEKMRANPYYTAQHLADKYGYTREYICQLYEKQFGIRPKKDPEYARREEEVFCRRHPCHRMARLTKKPGKNHTKKIAALNLFYEKCIELGFDIVFTSEPLSGYDMTVNGIKVNVKTASVAFSLMKKAVTLYYRAAITSNEINNLDVLAFYIYPQEKFYIIPNDQKGRNKRTCYYVPDRETSYRSKPNKMAQYKDAFYLFENQQLMAG